MKRRIMKWRIEFSGREVGAIYRFFGAEECSAMLLIIHNEETKS